MMRQMMWKGLVGLLLAGLLLAITPRETAV
jgi:hypothetical protein